MAGKTKKTTAPKKKPSSASFKKTTPQKPVLGLGTIITLVVFAALILATILINRKKETDAAEATPVGGEPAFVFTQADGIITGIKVEPTEGDTVELARNAQNVWELILPQKTEADQGMAEAAASQLVAINIVNPEITGNKADFGLEEPSYVITVTFINGKTHTLKIGDAAVSNNGYYAQLDNNKMMLVSLSGIDALTQLAFFPPYLNPPTPTALPATETLVPASETPTSTPAEVTVTPTP